MCQAYIGYFHEDNFNGFGRLVFKNKDVYTGDFKNNKMHDDEAVIEYSNKDKYEGAVASNKKHANSSEYTYINGDVYKGYFRGDKRNGDGQVIVNNHNIKYIAEFEEDKKTGKWEIQLDLNDDRYYVDTDFEDGEKFRTFSYSEHTLQKVNYDVELEHSQHDENGQLNDQNKGIGKLTIVNDAGEVFEAKFTHKVDPK